MDIKKHFEAMSGKRNSPEIEREFRKTCFLYEKKCSAYKSPFSQDYKNYIDLYHRNTSLYLTGREQNRTKLFIYDTENERREERILDTPEPLDIGTCIIQLPNGELFCFGKSFQSTGMALIVDKNYRVRVLPPGPPFWFPTGIYFNNCIYCFGGLAERGNKNISYLFGLNENKWCYLTVMPNNLFVDHSVLFDQKILISGYCNSNLLLYSIDIDSFSTIPYNFGYQSKKTLIITSRFYLIESFGYIYESKDMYNWENISSSAPYTDMDRSYCSYNKGRIYIIGSRHGIKYFNFDLG